MTSLGCHCQGNCPVAAVITGAIVGVVTAFLQITGVITVTPIFLWVAFGIAVAFLGMAIVAAALTRGTESCGCTGAVLTALLAGILGTVLFALLLLAVGITATSIVSALLVGLLLFFFTLTLTGSACLVKCLAGGEN